MTCRFAVIFGSTLIAGAVTLPATVAAQDRPVVVRAQPSDDIPKRRVSYTDLNLATASGEKTLHRRVGLAVSDVCEESTGPNALSIVAQRCRMFAWSGAKPQMARAIERAQQLAQYGRSSIELAAIQISVRSR